MDFNNKWTVYYHPSHVSSWSIDSYTKITTITNAQTFWEFMNNLPILSNGMFYIMKNDIPPMWEHLQNKNGGTWVCFVSADQITDYFIKCGVYLVTEYLTNKPDEIQGISITPKHQSYSIKIWNKYSSNHTSFTFNKDILTKMSYKKHF
jgi:hypothetical protein